MTVPGSSVANTMSEHQNVVTNKYGSELNSITDHPVSRILTHQAADMPQESIKQYEDTQLPQSHDTVLLHTSPCGNPWQGVHVWC